MIIDLLHNKIVADTLTEGFREAIVESLVPKLEEKYKDGLFGIQMYEDYISDGFKLDGYFYYPMTVRIDSECVTEWVRWEDKKGMFDDGIPYAYIGEEPLELELCEDAPKEFCEKLIGRGRFCESGMVKIKVDCAAPGKTFLSGKYSQTFVDEMARQLTPSIEAAMSVKGLAESPLELVLVFAPDTYLEHTSENVTYRRLLLTDKSSAPRDFWVKWTRLDGAVGYSVSSNVDGQSILFEIGDDVPQKVREKEYRFLVGAGKDKYHNAMGRRNVNEWRELIKRAVRRGELEKVERTVVLDPALDDQRRELERIIQGSKARAAAPAEEVKLVIEKSEGEGGEVEKDERAVLDALAVNAEDVSFDEDEYADENILDSEDDAEDDAEEEDVDGLEEYYSESEEAPSGASAENDEEAKALDDLTRQAKEALLARQALEAERAEAEAKAEAEANERARAEAQARASAAEITFGEPESPKAKPVTVVVPVSATAEEYEEIEDEDGLEELDGGEAVGENVKAVSENAKAVSDKAVGGAAPFVSPAPAVAEQSAHAMSRAELEETIRAEVEARIRLEYEKKARAAAEEEAERLRRQVAEMQLAAERASAEKARIEAESRREAEELKQRLEAQKRAEEKERDRITEAARIALAEQQRKEEEKLRAERERFEEEKRLEAERRRDEENKRIEEIRRSEAERIRRETEERIRAEEEAKRAAAAKYVEGADLAMPESTNYTYVSKTVKLIFRRPVDPNITGRIHEIIKQTLVYYKKEKVRIRIKATVPDVDTVSLQFLEIPLEEMELLSNIIKILGKSNLGIAKAILD